MNVSVENKEFLWRCKTNQENILYSQSKSAIVFKLWPVNTNKDYSIKEIEEYRKEALRKYPNEQRKINGFLNALQRLREEELLWVDFDDTYYLYSIAGSWKYLGKEDAHILPVNHKLKIEKAPGEIKNIFTGGGIIQRRYGKATLKTTKELIKETEEKEKKTQKKKGESSTTNPKEIDIKEKENLESSLQKEDLEGKNKKQSTEKLTQDLKEIPKTEGDTSLNTRDILEKHVEDLHKGEIATRPSSGLRVRNTGVEIYPLNDDVIEKILKNRKEEEQQEEYQFGDIVIEVYPKEEEVVVQKEESNFLPVPIKEKTITEYQERYQDFLALREHSIEMAKEHIDYFWNLHYSYLSMEKATLQFFAELQKIFFGK